MKITFATGLTLMRIVAVPVIIYCVFWGWWSAALTAFVLTAITDFFDGYVARNMGQQSLLGSCLDPLADKFLILAVYGAFMLLQVQLVPVWFFAVVCLKELILLTGVCVLLYLAYRRGKEALFLQKVFMQPSLLGKGTMALQVLFILWLLLSSFFKIQIGMLNIVLQIIILFFVLLTLLQYAQRGSELYFTYLRSQADE